MLDRLRTGSILRLLVILAFFETAASAQMFDMPAGDYGPPPPSFGPTTRCFDLSQADRGSWLDIDPDGDGPDGVYDESLGLVVYRLESLIFPTPAVGTFTYTFKNHITNCPVVFLVRTNFDLPEGVTLTLDGEDTITFTPPEVNLPSNPGPGGFRGGHSGTSGLLNAGPGFGIGGGQISGEHWHPSSCVGGLNHQSLQARSDYIPTDCLALIGGSGGASSYNWSRSGGAGGGAILIAVGGTATINGLITARGGDGTLNAGNGSGGAVRFAANAFLGDGAISVLGGGYTAVCAGAVVGGTGQIRIETPDTFAFPATGITLFDDLPSITSPLLGSGTELKLWPDSMDPFIRIRSIAGVDISGETTTGSFQIPDIVLSGSPSLLVQIETRGIDPADVVLRVRATQKHSPGQTAASSGAWVSGVGEVYHVGTTGGFDQWELVLPQIPGGYTAYQAYAEYVTP